MNLWRKPFPTVLVAVFRALVVGTFIRAKQAGTQQKNPRRMHRSWRRLLRSRRSHQGAGLHDELEAGIDSVTFMLVLSTMWLGLQTRAT